MKDREVGCKPLKETISETINGPNLEVEILPTINRFHRMQSIISVRRKRSI